MMFDSLILASVDYFVGKRLVVVCFVAPFGIDCGIAPRVPSWQCRLGGYAPLGWHPPNADGDCWFLYCPDGSEDDYSVDDDHAGFEFLGPPRFAIEKVGIEQEKWNVPIVPKNAQQVLVMDLHYHCCCCWMN